MRRIIAPSERLRVSASQNRYHFTRYSLVMMRPALLEPVVHKLFVVPECHHCTIGAHLLTSRADDAREGALPEFLDLPTASGQAHARRVRRLPLALRVVVGNVQVDRGPPSAPVVRQDVVRELQGVDVDLLHRLATAAPGSQLHGEAVECGSLRHRLDALR